MPGNPKRYELEAAVERAGGWDTVIAAIEDGGTMNSIAKRFGVSRSFFHLVMSHGTSPASKAEADERMARVRQAYQVRAEMHVEEALELVDGASETRDALTKVKMQVEFRQWMAGNDNARFRKQANTQVVVQIGELHLAALQYRAANPMLPASQPALPIRDAEIIEVEDAGPGDTQP